MARWGGQTGDLAQSRYTLREFAAAPNVLKPDDVSVIAEISRDPRLDDVSRSRLQETALATSALFVPLRAGGQWLGFVEAVYTDEISVGADETRRLLALASQAASTLQGLHLLREAQVRAQRERVLREITARVRNATDVDVIMKTAVREVSRALGRDAFVVLGNQQAVGEANGSPKLDMNGRQPD